MNLVEGVDVSHWQKPQDWHKHKADGKQFVFVKATEGVGYVDPMFKAHVQGARNAGLLVGAYHFFRPSLPYAIQAEHFLTTCSAVTLDLPPALDMETMDNASAEAVTVSSLLWLAEVGTSVRKTPIVYSGLYFINGLHNPRGFAKYPLWIPQYRNRMPTLPLPYTKWTFWQNSGTGIDHDYFNGSLEELVSLA